MSPGKLLPGPVLVIFGDFGIPPQVLRPGSPRIIVFQDRLFSRSPLIVFKCMAQRARPVRARTWFIQPDPMTRKKVRSPNVVTFSILLAERA